MKSAAADFDAARDAFRERLTTDGAVRHCTGGGATERSVGEGAPRLHIGTASTKRGVAPPQTPSGSSHCCNVEVDGVGADGAAKRRANNEADRRAVDGITSPRAGAESTKGCAHRAASPQCGGAHDDPTTVKGSDETSSLERFVREMMAMQDDAIDAALDVTGSSDEGAVKVVEEACWGSARSADGDVGGHLDEGTHDPDRHPVKLVEPAH